MNFLELVAHNIKKFNETDQRIINYIIENYDNMGEKRVSDIADDLFLAPNAIVRVAKKLGYSGYSEMKFAIVRDVENNDRFDVLTKVPNLEYKEAISKAVSTTLDINTCGNIDKAVRLITSSKSIVFFSLGITKNHVKAFIQQLQVFNKICLLSSDRDNALSLAKNIDKGFLAVFVSVSGETDALINSASYLKKKKIPIIALTGLNQNSLQDFADISLYAHANIHEVDGIDISSRAYINLVLDLIMEKIIVYYDRIDTIIE